MDTLEGVVSDVDRVQVMECCKVTSFPSRRGMVKTKVWEMLKTVLFQDKPTNVDSSSHVDFRDFVLAQVDNFDAPENGKDCAVERPQTVLFQVHLFERLVEEHVKEVIWNECQSHFIQSQRVDGSAGDAFQCGFELRHRNVVSAEVQRLNFNEIGKGLGFNVGNLVEGQIHHREIKVGQIGQHITCHVGQFCSHHSKVPNSGRKSRQVLPPPVLPSAPGLWPVTVTAVRVALDHVGGRNGDVEGVVCCCSRCR